MGVSVAICTRNRGESLGATLNSLARCTLPADCGAELIVVDNGSLDHTPEVVKAFEPPHLDVRYIRVSAPGLSRARNAALLEAKYGVLLFTDDDVIVPKCWIERMCQPILLGEADVAAGGVAIPAEYGLIRQQIHLGIAASPDDAFCLSHPIFLTGANMAVRRSVALEIGGFDTALGAGALGGGEDVFFGEQVERHGYRMIYVPQAAVLHYFDRTRLQFRHRIRAIAKGAASSAYHAHHYLHKGANGFPAPMVLDLIRAAVRFSVAIATNSWRLHRRSDDFLFRALLRYELWKLRGIARVYPIAFGRFDFLGRHLSERSKPASTGPDRVSGRPVQGGA